MNRYRQVIPSCQIFDFTRRTFFKLKNMYICASINIRIRAIELMVGQCESCRIRSKHTLEDILLPLRCRQRLQRQNGGGDIIDLMLISSSSNLRLISINIGFTVRSRPGPSVPFLSRTEWMLGILGNFICLPASRITLIFLRKTNFLMKNMKETLEISVDMGATIMASSSQLDGLRIDIEGNLILFLFLE